MPVQPTCPSARSAATVATSAPARTARHRAGRTSTASSGPRSHCRPRSAVTPRARPPPTSPADRAGFMPKIAEPRRDGQAADRDQHGRVRGDPVVRNTPAAAGPTMYETRSSTESSENAGRRKLSSSGSRATIACRAVDITGSASKPPTNDSDHQRPSTAASQRRQPERAGGDRGEQQHHAAQAAPSTIRPVSGPPTAMPRWWPPPPARPRRSRDAECRARRAG